MMRRSGTLVVVGLLVVPTLLVAAEEIKADKLDNRTLPDELYGQMTVGKKLSLVWSNPEFSGGTYRIGNVDWQAENRNGTLFGYLTEQTGLLGQEDGRYIVELRVSEYQGGKIGKMMGNKNPLLTVEGTVSEGDNIVAAFVSREKAKLGGFSGFNENAMVDAVLSGIEAELMNAKGKKSKK